MKRALVSFVAVLAVVIVGSVTWAAMRSSEPPHVRPAESRRELRPLRALLIEEALDRPSSELEALMRYLQARKLSDDMASVVAYADYLNALEAAAARAAAYRAPQPRATGPCGGATNGADQFIQRESGGDPYISNTGGSGAYGCYQIMPGTWTGACSDLGAQQDASPSTQAQCASRLPLSAWAQ